MQEMDINGKAERTKRPCCVGKTNDSTIT